MSKNYLYYASTEQSSNILYFSNCFVPDAFIAFSHQGKKYGILNALEFARVKKESSLDYVLSFEEYKAKAQQYYKKTSIGIDDIILLIAKELKIKSFTIEQNFPAFLFQKLIKRRLKLEILELDIIPERSVKTAKELVYLKAGNRASAAGIKRAQAVLAQSKIKQGKLFFKARPLTSEILKAEIEKTCIDHGAVSLSTIAAGGKQACDPHCTGHGQLRANEFIIIDVFPRIQKTGYHGDMSRTFLKGEASSAQRKLIRTVRQAQKQAMERIKSGVSGGSIHKGVVDFFNTKGYLTEQRKGNYVGFFHGLGHGIGLDVHEGPRLLTPGGGKLRKGNVVTVEPGLYYPKIGGVRIEDVLHVTAKGYDKLSSCHYKWEIK